MVQNTIIGVYGRQNEGKSTTIKNVCRALLTSFPNPILLTHDGLPINYANDILVSITIDNVKIGIESQGDPGSRMLKWDTLRYLADENFQIAGYEAGLGNCNIIVCASRTSGDTVIRIDQIAAVYNYRTLWKSSYYTPDIDHATVNQIAANEIVNLITLMMNNQL
jgi:hypothetical protein